MRWFDVLRSRLYIVVQHSTVWELFLIIWSESNFWTAKVRPCAKPAPAPRSADGEAPRAKRDSRQMVTLYVRTVKGRQNYEVYQYLNSILPLNSTLVLHAGKRGVLIWNPKLIHVTEYILKLPLRVTVINTILHYSWRKLKQQLVIINARLDALKQDRLPFVTGHAAA